MINANDKITLSVAEAVKQVTEKSSIDEGKMKQLDALVKKGVKDAKKIAKELQLPNDSKTLAAIEKLIGEALEGLKDRDGLGGLGGKSHDAFVDVHSVVKKSVKEEEEKDVEESNEFTKAAAKAKLAGEDEFEFEGKTYPVEIGQDAAEKIMGKSESVDGRTKEFKEKVKNLEYAKKEVKEEEEDEVSEARGGPPPLLTANDVKKKISDNDEASFYRGWTSDGQPMQLILKRYLVKKMNKGSDYDPYFDGTSLVGPGFSGKTALAGALDPKKGYKVKDLLKALKKFKG